MTSTCFARPPAISFCLDFRAVAVRGTDVLAAAGQLDGGQLCLVVLLEGGGGGLQELWLVDRKGFDVCGRLSLLILGLGRG